MSYMDVTVVQEIFTVGIYAVMTAITLAAFDVTLLGDKKSILSLF